MEHPLGDSGSGFLSPGVLAAGRDRQKQPLAAAQGEGGRLHGDRGPDLLLGQGGITQLQQLPVLWVLEF